MCGWDLGEWQGAVRLWVCVRLIFAWAFSFFGYVFIRFRILTQSSKAMSLCEQFRSSTAEAEVFWNMEDASTWFLLGCAAHGSSSELCPWNDSGGHHAEPSCFLCAWFWPSQLLHRWYEIVLWNCEIFMLVFRSVGRQACFLGSANSLNMDIQQGILVYSHLSSEVSAVEIFW